MAGNHSEYSYSARGADTAVIFVHGILGSPLQFSYMIDRLGGVYSIENLLLPGHGMTIKEFAASSMAEWQAYVTDRVRRLGEEYGSVVLVGHSMGCLLSVQAALDCPEKVKGLFLLAMPLVIRVKSPSVWKKMISTHSKDDQEEFTTAAVNGNSVRARGYIGYAGTLPQLAQLYVKSVKTRKLTARLTVPIVVVQSEHDETVSAKSLRYIQCLPNVRVFTVKDSGHFYYPKEIKEMLSGELERFISDVTAAKTTR